MAAVAFGVCGDKFARPPVSPAAQSLLRPISARNAKSRSIPPVLFPKGTGKGVRASGLRSGGQRGSARRRRGPRVDHVDEGSLFVVPFFGQQANLPCARGVCRAVGAQFWLGRRIGRGRRSRRLIEREECRRAEGGSGGRSAQHDGGDGRSGSSAGFGRRRNSGCGGYAGRWSASGDNRGAIVFGRRGPLRA